MIRDSRALACLQLALFASALAACESGDDSQNLLTSPSCTVRDEPAPPGPTKTPIGDFSKLNHIVVIYLENHSFDNLFGEFPNAENLSKATGAEPQVDAAG